MPDQQERDVHAHQQSPPRKTSAPKTGATNDRGTLGKAAKTLKSAAIPVTKVAAKAAAATRPAKTPRPRAASSAAGLQPSAALAAVIGPEPVIRTQVIKKLWDYIKAHGLQDAANKRAINSDAKLLAVFGKPQVTMFELAGIAGKHLS